MVGQLHQELDGQVPAPDLDLLEVLEADAHLDTELLARRQRENASTGQAIRRTQSAESRSRL